MLKEEIHVVFHGHVQGIGFRGVVKQYADQLDVHGFVRNMPDGSVEICAQAYQKDLQQLLDRLQKKFNRHIHHVDVEYRVLKTVYPDFQIIRLGTV